MRSTRCKALWMSVASLLLFSVFAPALVMADDWKVVNKERGITVWQQDDEDRGLPAFRGRVTIKAPIFRVLAILADFDHHCEWMHGCKKARLIKKFDNLHRLSYNRTDAPWPVSDRDVVLDSRVKVDSDKHRVTISFRGVQSPLQPEVEDVVRMVRLLGYYQMTAIDENTTVVQYQVDANPGGSLPDWVVRIASEDLPLNTLTNLRARASKPSVDARYQDFYKAWDHRLNPEAPKLLP